MSSQPAFTFLPLGAIIQSFVINGVNIVQGFVDQEDYVKHNGPFFGETIGRVANRIAGGKIDSLNGKEYSLAINNGPNALHGGNVGWGKKVWDGPSDGGDGRIVFKLRSEDGDEGYPGTVEATVTYKTTIEETSNGKVAQVLEIEYQAELVGDEVEETAINLTNHSYFNLSGAPTIEGTQVSLCSDLYLPVDDGGIPTAGPTKFAGLTAKETFTLGPVDPDIDDCFVTDTTTPAGKSLSESSVRSNLDTRRDPLVTLVTAYHPTSKIHLEVKSTEPAFQFYTGKYIDVVEVKGSTPARGARSGFCVEPSRFVNAVNVPGWKDQVLLKKGGVFGAKVVYKAWQD